MKAAEEKEITHISRRESDRDVVGPQQFVFQEFMRSQFETLRSDVRADVSAEIKAALMKSKNVYQHHCRNRICNRSHHRR